MYILYVHITRYDIPKVYEHNYEQNIKEVLLHVVGTLSRDPVRILLCVCTYQVNMISYILRNNKQQQQ